MKKKLKHIPIFTSDAVAERFVEKADLSAYDLSGFKRVHFEFQPKEKMVSIRLSPRLYSAVQDKAKKAGIKTQKFIRSALEMAVR